MSDKLTATDYKKIKTRERLKKDREFLKHMINLWRATHHRWISPVGGVNEDREWESNDAKIKYFKRFWRSKRSKEIKQQCNRKVRNSNEDVAYQNGEYKKVDDFWWEYD